MDRKFVKRPRPSGHKRDGSLDQSTLPSLTNPHLITSHPYAPVRVFSDQVAENTAELLAKQPRQIMKA